MAKKLLTSYTFTPGAANAGTVAVSGTYALEQFLLITNVTTGATIFQFNKSTKGGAVSTGGGNTTLTLETDTSSMSAGDRLQVFIDDAAAVAVSAASLPLPSGASTAANQTTANNSLSSIDGKLPALSSGRVPVDVGTSINVGEVEVKNDSGNPIPISDAGGSITVDGTVAISNSSVEIANDTGNPIPVGTAAQLNVTGSASALNADLISTACDGYRSVCVQITGTFVGTISFQVSNDNINWVNVAGKQSSDIAGNLAVTTPVPTIQILNLNGYQFFRARFTAYTSGTATANAYLSRESIPITAVQTAPTNTVVGSATTSNVTLYTVNSAATTNAANIKATAANLYGISAMNTSASTKYVRFYSKATAPTVGTDVPIMVVAIPATSSKEIEYVPALRIVTGLGVAITGGAAATDTTAVAAGDVQLLVSYA